MKKSRIAIAGASGYTGAELVRILLNHPYAELVAVTSESNKGQLFSDLHPQYRGIFDHTLLSIGELGSVQPDLVFLGLPHGVSMDFVFEYREASFKIIDLSGDFRLPDAGLYEEWYGQPHIVPELLSEFTFGLPELFRESIKGSKWIANPGCYPTSAILGLAPLLGQNLIDPVNIIIDSKSGVTGAGIKAKPNTHFPSVYDNFTAYGISNHRHSPEIASILSEFCGNQVKVLFTPHLLPVDRGILSTMYVKPAGVTDSSALYGLYREFYHNEQFIRIAKNPPQIKQVRGSNYCDIYPVYDERTDTIIIISVIDNLVKGASGQAVQNMNLLLGYPENLGLNLNPLYP
jgi:N-acetyl-gamma-glutamyl-phosphate reductase